MPHVISLVSLTATVINAGCWSRRLGYLLQDHYIWLSQPTASEKDRASQGRQKRCEYFLQASLLSNAPRSHP